MQATAPAPLYRLGWCTSELNSPPNGTAATWTYTYDQFSLPSSISAPDGEVTQWNRNVEGVLQTITHNDKDGTSTETFGYDANGDITSDVVTRGGVVGISKHAIYDELGRVHQQAGNNGQSLTYAYDGNGNVHSISNAGGHTAFYAYDQLNRVKTITESGGATPVPPSTAPSISLPSSSANGAFTASWTAVTGASSYLLQEQINGGGWAAVQNSSATSWSASGRSNGSYNYRVSACDVAGCGPWSATANTTVTLAPANAPSLTVPPSSATGTYTVSWSSVNYATTYTLQEQVNGGGWSTVATSAATSWSASGKANGNYGYQVQACNAGGCSTWSNIGATTVLLPPGSAPTMSVPSSSATGNYTVSWSGVSGATSYTLQEQVNGGGWSTVQNTGATSWNTGARSNASYSYRVSACNVGGCGPWSATGSITVTVAPATAPSLSVPPSSATGTYTVSWSSVNYATSYTLQEQVNGGAWASASTGATLSWTINGRTAGTYGYRVQACDIYGCSGWSATSTVTVSIPIAVNGQSYVSDRRLATGQFGNGTIGFDIAGGNTWEVFHDVQLKTLIHSRILTGVVPAAAVTVQFTWTYTGAPAGYADGQGNLYNGATIPVAISSNPGSEYSTAGFSAPNTLVARTYQVRIDFFNATGVNISSSTCTLTAELEVL